MIPIQGLDNKVDYLLPAQGEQREKSILESLDQSFQSNWDRPFGNEGMYDRNRAMRGVTIGDVHQSLMNLPQIMEKVSDYIEGAPDRDWALSIISPFHAASKGTRIPCF